MAVTWVASSPHTAAVKEIEAAGLGSGWGLDDSSVFANVTWPGAKRAVLTKLTATGTYTTGGDAIDETLLGFQEIFAAFIVASPTTNVKPSINGQDTAGVPTLLCTTTNVPKVQYFDAGVEASSGVTLTGDVFHVILVGI